MRLTTPRIRIYNNFQFHHSIIQSFRLLMPDYRSSQRWFVPTNNIQTNKICNIIITYFVFDHLWNRKKIIEIMIHVTTTAPAAGSTHSVRHSPFQSHMLTATVSLPGRSVGMENNNKGRRGNKSAMHIWWRSLVCWHIHTAAYMPHLWNLYFRLASRNYEISQSSHCGHVTHPHAWRPSNGYSQR